MNIISSLLLFIGNKLKTCLYKTATVAVGEGTCRYVHFGNLVVCTFQTATTTAISQYAVICSGLPAPLAGAAIGHFDFYLNAGSYYIDDQGNIKTATAFTAGSRSLRGSFAYISNTVGGVIRSICKRFVPLSFIRMGVA